jgi:hypothetical protein
MYVEVGTKLQAFLTLALGRGKESASQSDLLTACAHWRLARAQRCSGEGGKKENSCLSRESNANVRPVA